jgi:hypothetical protein
MSVHIKAFVTYVLQQVFLRIRLKYSPWYSLLLMATAASAQRLVNCGGGGISGQSTVAAASAVGWLRRRERSVGGVGTGSDVSSRSAAAA